MTRLTTVLVVLAAALALPATVSAQSPETNAPPGNSAIDEYLETVPGATGDRPPRTPGGGVEGAAQDNAALPAAQRDALEAQGPEGQALADMVEATAPPRRRRPAPERAAAPPPVHSTTIAADAALAQADAKAESPLSATLAAAVGPNDGGGLGIFFPLLLLASLVTIVGLGVLRRRPL